MDKLKNEFPRQLWRYWPAPCDFEDVRIAYALQELEQIRRRLDFLQAVRTLRQQHVQVRTGRKRGKPPTAENLRPLLHTDVLAHINDNGQELFPEVVDCRQPQRGLTVYEFRKRYQLKQEPWKSIIAEVYGIRGSVPGVEDKQAS